MRRITGILIAGVSFGGAVTLFGVALVDAMRVETAPQVAVTGQAATDLAGPVGAPAVARGLESAQPGRVFPDLEAWAAETTSPRQSMFWRRAIYPWCRWIAATSP